MKFKAIQSKTKVIPRCFRSLSLAILLNLPWISKNVDATEQKSRYFEIQGYVKLQNFFERSLYHIITLGLIFSHFRDPHVSHAISPLLNPLTLDKTRHPSGDLCPRPPLHKNRPFSSTKNESICLFFKVLTDKMEYQTICHFFFQRLLHAGYLFFYRS